VPLLGKRAATVCLTVDEGVRLWPQPATTVLGVESVSEEVEASGEAVLVVGVRSGAYTFVLA